MKTSKRIIGLSRHAYAPELNRLVVDAGNGRQIELKAPGCTTVKEAREKALGKFEPHGPLRHCTVKTVYQGEHAWLNRTHSGTVESYAQLKAFMTKLRATMLPGQGELLVKTQLLG